MKCITVHQRVRDGAPCVAGSCVRTPDGAEIPCNAVHIEGVAGESLWRATLEVFVRFGEPVDDEEEAARLTAEFNAFKAARAVEVPATADAKHAGLKP